MLRENAKKLLKNAVLFKCCKNPLRVENHLESGLVGVKTILFLQNS
jgi:hypothetical protein